MAFNESFGSHDQFSMPTDSPDHSRAWGMDKDNGVVNMEKIKASELSKIL